MLDRDRGKRNNRGRGKSADIKFSHFFQVVAMSGFHLGKSLLGMGQVWVRYWSEQVLNNI